jgi:citrate lyase beta subunit
MLRSLLFVPADSERKLAKAKALPADALVLDWEDGVGTSNKPAARRHAIAALQAPERFEQLLIIRVNRAGSDSFREDCEALLVCLPDALMLSKCGSVSDLNELMQFLNIRDPEGACPICPFIESPGGLLNAHAIAVGSERVFALAFGAEDFSAELGLRRTEDEIELLYARSALVTAARAAGREAFDSPCLTLGDETKLAQSAARARNLGFSGKLAIHPEQVPVLNTAFSPTAEEVDWARRVLEAGSGGGAHRSEGQMVDEAVLRQARRILRPHTKWLNRHATS